MNAASGLPPSKGMMMVATYRAERLNQRPILRTNLHESHAARRAARIGGRTHSQPADTAQDDASPAVSTTAETVDSTSVFAGLVSTATTGVEQQSEAGYWQGMQAELARSTHAETTETEKVEVPVVEIAIEGGPERPAGVTTSAPQQLPQAFQAEAAAPSAPTLGSAADVVPPQQTIYDPPLAEIGFGPGMLIRLSQLGLYTTSDLAQADAFQLRSALGDISRLVDVDAWIRSARQTVGSTASRTEPSGVSRGVPVPV